MFIIPSKAAASWEGVSAISDALSSLTKLTLIKSIGSGGQRNVHLPASQSPALHFRNHSRPASAVSMSVSTGSFLQKPVSSRSA
jgi:hypothetical protein